VLEIQKDVLDKGLSMRENPFYNFWIDKGWTEIYIQHVGFPKEVI